MRSYGARIRIERERVTDIVAGAESVVDRPEVETGEVDGVESERVNSPDRVVQREMSPRAFPELVGIVVNEPVRVELGGELRLPEKNALPLETCRHAVLDRVSETFDAQDTAAEVRLDDSHRAIGGTVVQEIDVDALLDKVADDVLDDVRFVVRGDDRDNREIRRHGREGSLQQRRRPRPQA